jgi:two-component system, NarL family, sensor kinase
VSWAEGTSAAERAVALLRVAALPIIFVGEQLVTHPDLGGRVFKWLLALGCGYALLTLAAAWRGWGRRLARSVYPAVDVVMLSVLTYTSGGAFSQLRLAFFVLPVAAAFLLSAPATALWSALSVGSYLAVSLMHPATNRGADFEFVLSQTLYLTWMGLAAVLLATILTHRARRVEELATARGRLLTEVLGAEERERKRLAEALHDEAIQDLLAAGQDLDEARGGDEAALRRAREEVRSGVAQLRTTVAELHPFVLDHAGLEAALRSMVDRRRQRGTTRWKLFVDHDAVGQQDRLVVSVARELIENAAKHAGAAEVSVRLRRVGGEILVEVADDGPGLDPARARQAVAEGHVGLASCAERVQAAGGRLELIEPPGGGTLARARLPVVLTSIS